MNKDLTARITRRFVKMIANTIGMTSKHIDSGKDDFSRLIDQAVITMAMSASELSCDGIVFSMDRALQLHALLGSYRDHVINGPKLTVIYRTSSESHRIAYCEVFSEFSDVVQASMLQETRESFRNIIIDLLNTGSQRIVFFLVDDNLFIEPVDLQALSAFATPFSIPSLRMGKNLRKSYTMQQQQPTPVLREYPEALGYASPEMCLLSWQWACGALDWAYPLSVDGHLLPKEEVLAMARTVEFTSPNTFEANLQAFAPAYLWRSGICFKKSRLINIPYNRVQTDVSNLHGEIHQDDMLTLWQEGQRIDRNAYYGMVNESAHQELPLKLVKANSR